MESRSYRDLMMTLLNWECDHGTDSYHAGKIEGLTGINCEGKSVYELLTISRGLKDIRGTERGD